ncbi:MAG: hypothetical protein JW700_01980 [Candidatus Aenigmarchaeota archaeon]|nr:hypothetical protein [Candidatus Aenigmarchaeota archaeon]
MKGQYLTLEYVMFFVIGLVLIVSVYYIFSDMIVQYEDHTTQYQLEMTGHMILGTAIRLYETSENTNTKISYDLDIPEKLSNCIYTVTILNNFLRLDCIEGSDIGVALTSYNFNIEIKNNIIYSSSGSIKVTAENGEIDLE